MPGLATAPDPAPAEPPPAKFGADERATWAAYAAALRGAEFARAGDPPVPMRAAPERAA